MTIFYEPINVKEYPYNAVGDGVHDDTAAIQAALNFAMGGNPTDPSFNPIQNTKSYTLYFPAGDYKITKSLTWIQNGGNSLKVVGDNMGAEFGSRLLWYGGNSTITTTIASGSNGQALQQATINVASTAGFPTSGNLYVTTGSGTWLIFYTGISGNSFTGCTGGNGTMSTGGAVVFAGVMWHFFAASGCVFEHIGFNGLNNANTLLWFHTYFPRTTIASGSNGLSLPQSTINVANTEGFFAPGTIEVTTGAGVQTVSYTGITSTSFTGCTGGTGVMSTGGSVSTLIDSFNNKFDHCVFNAASGSTASDGSGAVLVKCNDADNTAAVAIFVFHSCTFTGNGWNDGETFACVQPMQSGSGNTETFSFYDCQMSVAQYCFYFQNSKNQCLFYECQMGAVSKALIYTNGTTQVRVIGGGTENGIPSGPYAHKGMFSITGLEDVVHIDSCEIVMDGYNSVVGASQPGVLFWANGQLKITNCLIDATQGGASGFTNTIPSVVLGFPGTQGSVVVEQCQIVNALLSNDQFLVQSSGTDLYTGLQAGQFGKTSISLRGNTGNTFGNNLFILPDFESTTPNFQSLGPTTNLPTAPFFATAPIYQCEPRISTTCYEIDYTNVAFQVGSTVQFIYPCSLKPRTSVIRMVVEVVTPFKGGSITSLTMSVGNQNDVGVFNRYIQASDIWTSAAFYGLVNSDLGVGLARATAVQGADFGNFLTVFSGVIAQFTAGGSNLGTGSATHLTQGQLKIYLTTEMVG